MDDHIDDQGTDAAAQLPESEESGVAADMEAGSGAILAGLQADLRQGLVALGQKVTRLEHNFDTKIMYDQSKDETIDALHRELQSYREGMAFVHLRPMVSDLLALHDDLDDLLAGFVAQYPDQAEQDGVRTLLNSVDTVREDLIYMLEKYGFEVFENPGEAVDRKVQRVQSTVPTVNEALDRTVAQRLRKGVRYEDRIVRPEVVAAYRFTEGD